jgi:hypothetical protein
MPPKSTKGGKRGRPKKEKKEEAGEESKAPVEKKKKIDEKVEDEEKAKWWEEPICANLNLRAKMQGDYKEFKSISRCENSRYIGLRTSIDPGWLQPKLSLR